MKRSIVMLGVLGAIAGLTAKQAPELRRYMKMRTM
jgi:hypothetical protein